MHEVFKTLEGSASSLWTRYAQLAAPPLALLMNMSLRPEADAAAGRDEADAASPDPGSVETPATAHTAGSSASHTELGRTLAPPCARKRPGMLATASSLGKVRRLLR